ncbi:unnamed protein product [Phytophthora lilii]|uniref:Unnamed protein product n=1 Tax=Phytophthora lilii TaxID=2077276 RepID=A0A9W6TDV8_9STRA|nr:unnamed protein product [Phytophthora lilii]
MAMDNSGAITFLVPRCFRRKNTPPTSERAGNIFEQRMQQQLKKQCKRSSRATRARPQTTNEFMTFDLLAARDRSVATKNPHKMKRKQWPQVLSWDSLADTFISPPSSVGAEAGGIIGTTHTRNPPDDETSSRYTAQLSQQELSQEAIFRLQQLGRLDMSNSTPSFVYQVPRQSAREWSVATTEGSTGDNRFLHSLT